MEWVYISFIYFIVLAFLIRFFQTVHTWDEEIKSMKIGDQTNGKT